MQLAQRRLGSQDWKHHRFPVQTRWATGGHAKITMAVDLQGHVHVAAYRRDLSEQPPGPPATIYYRTTRPHDLATLKRTHMVSPDEPNPGYPTFIEGTDNELYFEYRIGGSGRGSQRWNVYDPGRQQWQALPILLDGQGRRSAYGGPRLGPGGRWHCSWVWRETPDAETSNIVAYMRSDDLRHWENAAGEALELPITADNKKVVVDPVKQRAGLINSVRTIGWDSDHQPIISYHKYDENGNSQIYNARYEDGRWHIVQATDWDFRWDFGGRGALGRQVDVKPVTPAPDGRLHQQVMNLFDNRGWRWVVLDGKTLRPVKQEQPAATGPENEVLPPWQRLRDEPESDFEARPMEVHWLPDNGKPSQPSTQYWLRWEVGPVNKRDQPVPPPWPDATTLRVYKLVD
ncbi:MAG: BNR repeat-containing protein [Opitutales bacterium]